LFKWWWRFITEEGPLWKTVIQAIHREKGGLLPDATTNTTAGPWCSIRKLLNDQGPSSLAFLKQLRVEVGNGEKTKFWEDPWMQEGAIQNMFPELYNASGQKHTVIARMGWFEGQEWRWILVWSRELSWEELQQIDMLQSRLQQYRVVQNKEDKVWWGTEKCYTVRALQKELSSRESCENIVCKAWLNLAPPKVEFFMWLAILGKLNTRENLWKKGILKEDQISCPFCAEQVETLDHILMACPVSWGVWVLIAKDMQQNISKPETFKQHFERWITRRWKSTTMKKFWQSVVFAIAWSLWNMRNEVIFQQKEVDVPGLYNIIKWRITFWSKAWMHRNLYSEGEMVRHFADIPRLLQ